MGLKRASQVILSVVMVVGLAVTLRATQTAPADPLTALLGEVHALRLAMEQQASVGPRMQLTLSRLTIEEQRVTHLNAELDSIRQQLDATGHEGKGTEYALAAEQRAVQTEGDPAKRSAHEEQIEILKHQLGANTANEQRLRGRENDVLQALASEQSRWIDLNARLDELERLLGPVR
jgi:hypothetical protein